MVRCGRVGCIKKFSEYTPCCHEPVCEKHSKRYPLCSREECDNYHIYDGHECKACIQMNSETYFCAKYKQAFCHNCAQFICDCEMC